MGLLPHFLGPLRKGAAPYYGGISNGTIEEYFLRPVAMFCIGACNDEALLDTG